MYKRQAATWAESVSLTPTFSSSIAIVSFSLMIGIAPVSYTHLGHDSIAVDRIPIPGAEVKEGFSRIPMWVADMNFPSLPTIQEAIHARRCV